MILNINNRWLTGTRGFTLVETVVYLAVIGFIFIGFVSYALSVNAIKEKNQALENVNYNLNFALAEITEQIRSAETILTPAVGATENSLEILDENNIGRNYHLAQKKLLSSASSGEDIYLTNNDAELIDLYFVRMDEKTIKIGIAMTEIGSDGQPKYSVNGQAAATLRK